MTHSFSDISSLQTLIRVLADGQFHSGQELGDLLGVSRAAVWKHLQKLEILGLKLIAIKGKGYCLENQLDLLNVEQISNSFSDEASQLLRHLDIQTVTDSTNIQAMRTGAKGHVYLAEHQTAGKGRRGRTWVSPFGANIYCSVVWTYEGAEVLEGLSLAVGVAIAEALHAWGIEGVQLKWPNDVLWKDKKLAGILLEMSGDPSGACRVVVGVGINVSMPASMESSIDQPWIDLQTILDQQKKHQKINRNQLVALLLSKLLPLLNSYADRKFEYYRNIWLGLNAHANKSIEVHTAQGSVQGKMVGVSESGALKVLTDNGEVLFYGGEMSLRARS